MPLFLKEGRSTLNIVNCVERDREVKGRGRVRDRRRQDKKKKKSHSTFGVDTPLISRWTTHRSHKGLRKWV